MVVQIHLHGRFLNIRSSFVRFPQLEESGDLVAVIIGVIPDIFRFPDIGGFSVVNGVFHDQIFEPVLHLDVSTVASAPPGVSFVVREAVVPKPVKPESAPEGNTVRLCPTLLAPKSVDGNIDSGDRNKHKPDQVHKRAHLTVHEQDLLSGGNALSSHNLRVSGVHDLEHVLCVNRSGSPVRVTQHVGERQVGPDHSQHDKGRPTVLILQLPRNFIERRKR